MYFVVTVDTEEEGLWSGKYSREVGPVKNIQGIHQFQNICDQYSITPTYLTAYSVCKTPAAPDILGPIEASRGCEIGGHLHPWNTPPFEETPSVRNTLLCHLEQDIIEKKLEVLLESHSQVFGKRPTSFRSGRWGFNAKVARALEKFGFDVDTSISPFWDFTSEGIPLAPNVLKESYWLDSNHIFSDNRSAGTILEVPATIGFNRSNFQSSHKIHSYLKRSKFKRFRVLGLLHYLSVLKLIPLCPELASLDQMATLAKVIKKRGGKILNLFFHSSSLLPGCSPYVRNREELTIFMNKLDKFFNFLEISMDINNLTLSELNAVKRDGLL